MKLWISLALIAIIALTIVYLQSNNQPQPAAVATPAAATLPLLPLISQHHTLSHVPKKIRAVEESANNDDEQPTEQTDPASKPDQTAALLKWEGTPLDLPDLKADDHRVDCTALMLSYGDQLKVEHKAYGKDFDSAGCRNLETDFVAAKNQ